MNAVFFVLGGDQLDPKLLQLLLVSGGDVPELLFLPVEELGQALLLPTYRSS